MLVGESLEEFQRFKSALYEEIRPNGPIEEMLASEIAESSWQIFRLTRFKSHIIDSRRSQALESLLYSGLQVLDEKKARNLARRYHTDPEAKKEVLLIFEKFNLEEGAIEAEAIRHSLDDLEKADKILCLAVARRNNALRQIREYREAVAERWDSASKRLIEKHPDRWLAKPSAPKEV
jgi:hypothetical protein